MLKQTFAIPGEAQRRAQEVLSRWRISPNFIAELIGHRAPITFARGQAIFIQESAADVGYFVLSGLAKVYFPLRDGSRVVMRLAGAGDFIGVVDAIGTNGRHAQALEAEAMTKVSVAIFTRDHVLAMLNSMPSDGLVALLEEVNTTWSEVFSWYARFLGLSFHDRLISVFKHLADRFGVKESRGVLLTPELSQDDLAEMIASSRPMVSRLVAEMVEQRVIARQGRRYILLDNSVAGSIAEPRMKLTKPFTNAAKGCSPMPAEIRGTDAREFALRDRRTSLHP